MNKLLPLILLLLPFSFALNPTEGIDLPLIRLAPVLLFLLWAIHSGKKGSFSWDNRLIFWLWLAFLGLTLLSFLWAENPAWSFRKSLLLFSFLPFYLFSFSFFHKKEVFPLFRAFFIGAGSLALIGWVQFFSVFFLGIDRWLFFWNKFQAFFLGRIFSQTVLNFPSFLVNIGGQTLPRAFGTLPDPHLFGAYLALALPFGCWLFEKTGKKVYLIGSGLILGASLLSFSRTVYLMLLAEILLSALLFLKRKTLILAASLFLFLLLPLLLATENPVKSRFLSSFDLHDGSVAGRLDMWEKAFQTFGQNPWGGVGLGNFPLKVNPRADFREPISAHNLFLDFLAETGLFSFVLLIFILGLPLGEKLSSSSQSAKPLAIFFLGFLIYALFENPFFSLQLFPLFLIFLAL